MQSFLVFSGGKQKKSLGEIYISFCWQIHLFISKKDLLSLSPQNLYSPVEFASCFFAALSLAAVECAHSLDRRWTKSVERTGTLLTPSNTILSLSLARERRIYERYMWRCVGGRSRTIKAWGETFNISCEVLCGGKKKEIREKTSEKVGNLWFYEL